MGAVVGRPDKDGVHGPSAGVQAGFHDGDGCRDVMPGQPHRARDVVPTPGRDDPERQVRARDDVHAEVHHPVAADDDKKVQPVHHSLSCVLLRADQVGRGQVGHGVPTRA